MVSIRTMYCYPEMTGVFGTSLGSYDNIKITFSKIIVPPERNHKECAYYALEKQGIKSPELEMFTDQLENEIKKTPIIWKLITFYSHNRNISLAQCPTNIVKLNSEDESTWYRPGDKIPDEYLRNTSVISWDTEPKSCIPSDFPDIDEEPTVLFVNNGKEGVYTLKEMAERSHCSIF